MKNLVIGNTSQLSYYFPNDYIKISSRDINFTEEQYDRVYICFAEQRTYITDDKNLFYDTNINYTLKVIDHFYKYCNKIIIYATSELWNKHNGFINMDTPFNYKSTDYIDTKMLLIQYVKYKYRDKIIILYPFNFNSVHRKHGFLFYKIFDSIIYNKKIEIGDTYFYRELLHPKFVVEQSINSETDTIIGSGRLTFVNDFIRNLYSYFNMNYDDYVYENLSNKSQNSIFYLESKHVLYNELFDDTISELVKLKNNI